jgi:DNA polymerase III epsilon subunit-like protein
LISIKNCRTIQFLCRPFDFDTYDDTARKLLNIIPEEINRDNNRLSPKVVLDQLIKLFDKYVSKYDKKDKFSFIGYNCNKFDMPFLRKFFEKNNHKYFGSYFWFPSVDVMLMASEKLEEKRSEIESFKLSSIAKYLGIEVKEDELHDAMYDIYLTRNIYYKLKRNEF